MKKRNYIGVANSFHDSALSVVNSSGEVVFAESTERYIQYKRALNVMPDLYSRTSKMIEQYCEPDAEIVIAYAWSKDAGARAPDDLLIQQQAQSNLLATAKDLPAFIVRDFADRVYAKESQMPFVTQTGVGLKYAMSQLDGMELSGSTSRYYDHHLTHAATACFTSPFKEATCAIIDGYGEGAATACYSYANGKLSEIKPSKCNQFGSLGLFYMDICNVCGFDSLGGEEWKVMGLAPYGEIDSELYLLLNEIISVNGINIEFAGDQKITQLRSQLHEYRLKNGGGSTVANIAYTGQLVFVEVVQKYLNNLYPLGDSKNLIMGGGCVLNSCANGAVLDSTPFENLHVFSAPADDGNAIGAALLAYQEDCLDYQPVTVSHSPYLGSSMSEDTLNNVIRFGGLKKCITCKGNAPERAAELLAEGKIIGWIQGRAEFGPRALGNRSILADPRSPAVKDMINSRVKFREEFRPFAPSILHEFGDQYFENYQESRYMERTLKFRPDVVSLVPGVVHEDQTGRLQTVKREWNDGFFRLIYRFWELTDVPLVLNTSYNVMGKPISHSVEDVLAVFFTTGLDAVFIDNVLIEK